MATAARIPAQRGRRQPAPVVPLGSLTQRGDRPGAAARACGSMRVTRLSMNLTDGIAGRVHVLPPLRAPHLGRAGGELLAVDRVLDKTRKR